MKADLHSHSIYSDGIKTIKELIYHAKENKLNILALTDHDSVLGCKEFLSYNSNDLLLIPGIELSCKYKDERVHIVGLFKNKYIPDEMYEFSNTLLENRRNRGVIMAQKINEIYHTNIDIDLLVKENKTITRKNIVDHLMKYCNLDYDTASEYVSEKSKAYVSMERFSVKDGIDFLHKNNCICIFAHPCLIKDKNKLNEILENDFDGIEAKYANIKNDYEYFKNIAINKNWLISAGSDYHGDFSHGDLGDVSLNLEEAMLILDKLNIKYDN